MNKGERIRKLREAKGITQEELAKLLNTTKQTVSKYEKDIVTNIPSDRLEELSHILDTTPSYLMGWNQKQIDSATEMIKEKNEQIDKSEGEFKPFMEEFCELQLTKEEIQEVFEYALYIKSKRK